MADKIISTVKRRERERCGGRELLLLLNVSICGYHLSLPTVKLLSSSAAHNLIASEDILLCRWWPSLRLKYYHQLNASFLSFVPSVGRSEPPAYIIKHDEDGQQTAEWSSWESERLAKFEVVSPWTATHTEREYEAILIFAMHAPRHSHNSMRANNPLLKYILPFVIGLHGAWEVLSKYPGRKAPNKTIVKIASAFLQKFSYQEKTSIFEYL